MNETVKETEGGIITLCEYLLAYYSKALTDRIRKPFWVSKSAHFRKVAKIRDTAMAEERAWQIERLLEYIENEKGDSNNDE